MDYNTQRPKLVLPEYGRNVQKLVDYALNIKDKDERTRFVKNIISIMGNLNPQLREMTDIKHKLWDQMAIISDFNLDVDSPFPLPKKEHFLEKPRPVFCTQSNIRFRHYGKIIAQLIEKAVELPDGKEKEALTEIIANHMKKSFLIWNRESVTDDVIFSDMKVLSKGKLSYQDTLKLSETRDILLRNKKPKRITGTGTNTNNSNNNNNKRIS